MAGIVRSAAVRLDAIVAPYVAGMGKASAATTAFARQTDAQLTGTTAKTTKLGQSVGLLPGKFGALATVGGAAFAGVGLAVAASVKRFAEFDVAMDAVAASTGASSVELEQLGDTAMQAAAETKFGAIDAARGIEALSKAGIETADIVGGALKGSLDLAAAGEIEVAEAAEVAASAMTTFGLSGRELPHVADLFAAAAGKAQGSVEDMSMAFNQTAQVADMMGLSIEETTGTLAAFASTGLIGSDAGTSFRTMLIRLANPTGKAAELMEDLGLSAYDASGQFVGMAGFAGQLETQLGGLTQEQRNAALATIFGNDAIRAANVVYEQGQRGIEQWTDAVSDTGYAAEQARRRTDNLTGDVERLGGELEKLLITGGAAGEGPLRDFVQLLEKLTAEVNEEEELWRERYIPTLADVDTAIDRAARMFGINLPQGLLGTRQEMEHVTETATLLATETLRDHAALERYTSAQQDAAGATGFLTDEMEEQRQELFDLTTQFLEGRDATRDWYASVDEASAALERNGVTLDTTTEAGRDNEEALDAMAAAAIGLLEDMTLAGENTDTVSSQMRETLAQTGIRFGMTEEDAYEYADQIIRIPKTVTTTPTFADAEASRKVREFKDLLAGIDETVGVRVTATTDTGGLGGFWEPGATSGGFPLPGGAGAYRISQGPHDGGAIDYVARVGTPIRAPYSGYLDVSDLGNRSYGKYYTLRGGGRSSLGAHLSGFARGDGLIGAGQMIGWTGNTGNSTGPHFHYRAYALGGPVPSTGPIYAHGGEYVVNAGATAANRGLLEAINAGRGGAAGPVDLSRQSIRAIGQVVAGEVLAAVGAGAYTAGQRATMYARAG